MIGSNFAAETLLRRSKKLKSNHFGKTFLLQINGNAHILGNKI